MIRQGRSALRTTVIPVFLVRPKVDQTKAGNGNFFGVQGKHARPGQAAHTLHKQFIRWCFNVT
ncbi:hypothetical protein CFBP7129_18500 [Agrobacterium tumefaciens]|uniref:Uncharacterized protein n=1 Tax=Agrobacterium tumefaciens TaxID=358 RepID=A0A4D7YZ63_AGRTU|nr:hypothetical protein CFBP7129_18500 [Agrobacterium tumefaciens]